MTKKQLKKLLKKSYTGNKLDSEKVEVIANALERHELKEYIKGLKLTEKKESIVISLPYLPSNEEKNKFDLLYPKKQIIYDIDPSLMIGVRITNNDIITDYSMENALDTLLDNVRQTYD